MFAESLTMIETARIAALSDPRRRMAGWSGQPEPTSARPTPGSVRLRGLSKAFGDVSVLDGVDLTIPAGQFVAIVGKSGCGKSTLLRLVMGLETPSSGTIEGVGRREGVEGGAARFMFQEPRLMPWARVAENVAVGLGSGLAKSEKRRRALAALEEVGLADRADAWPTILSGGQRQRVALARALVGHPHLLAFDEPLGALDALTRISMQRLVERVWLSQGFTAILVTHDVGEAIALADRILLIEAGSIALDISVDLPRPRRRGTPGFATLEKTVLDALFAGAGDAV